VTLFHIVPKSHRGGRAGVVGEIDLDGFAVVGPDGEEVEWSSSYDGQPSSHVVKIAARLNAQYPSAEDVVRCKLCSAVVTSGDPQRYPYCRTCHYVGSATEDVRSGSLAYFRRLFPDAVVGVDHTGGGCFWMSVRWKDSPTYYALTDGEASLPTDEDGNPVRGRWGYVGRYCDDEDSDDYEGCTIGERQTDYSDDPTGGLSDPEVVAIIRADLAARAQ
jgi:hypothetical protein